MSDMDALSVEEALAEVISDAIEEVVIEALEEAIPPRVNDLRLSISDVAERVKDVTHRMEAAERLVATASPVYDAAKAQSEHATLLIERIAGHMAQVDADLREELAVMKAAFLDAVERVAAFQVVIDAMPAAVTAQVSEGVGDGIDALTATAQRILDQRLADQQASLTSLEKVYKARSDALIEQAKVSYREVRDAAEAAILAQEDMSRHESFAKSRVEDAEWTVSLFKATFMDRLETAMVALSEHEEAIRKLSEPPSVSGAVLRSYRGGWSTGVEYTPGDVVSFGSGLWVCQRTTKVQPGTPQNTDWLMMLAVPSMAGGFTKKQAMAGVMTAPAAFYQDTPPSAGPNNWQMAGYLGHVRIWYDTVNLHQYVAVQDAGGNWTWGAVGGMP